MNARSGNGIVVRRASGRRFAPARRAGFWEARLLTGSDCAEQHVVLVRGEEGAVVEEHEVANSESFFVLAGRLRVLGARFDEELGPGDFCLFAPGGRHGVAVLEGPAEWLVVFAPGR